MKDRAWRGVFSDLGFEPAGTVGEPRFVKVQAGRPESSTQGTAPNEQDNVLMQPIDSEVDLRNALSGTPIHLSSALLLLIGRAGLAFVTISDGRASVVFSR